MSNNILYIIALLLLSVFKLSAQDNDYTFVRKALNVGEYDYSKIPQKEKYKIYYEEEAEAEWSKDLLADERLRNCTDFGQYIVQEDSTTIYFREEEAYEYCPELHYVMLTGGHGYVQAYDLRTLESVAANPSTYVYSPSRKYRFGSLEFDGFSYYIEVLTEGKYTPYKIGQIAKNNMSGAYWHNDNTLHFLEEKRRGDDSKYWIGYSITVQPKE